MNIRKLIREEVDDFQWIRDIPGEIPEIDDENKFLILVNLLGIEEVFGDVIKGFDDSNTDFEQNPWTHYGIDTFTLDNGEEWAVGSEEEFDDALYEYWYGFSDDVGIENVYNFESYLYMSDLDRRFFAQDMAVSYTEDLSDEDVIEVAGYDEEWEELEYQIDELESERSFTNMFDNTSIDNQISDLESEKDNLIDRARESVRENHYDEWYDCLVNPYQCLVREHGLYMGGQDLLDSGNVYFDDPGFTSDMVDNSHYGDLSSYDGEYYEEDGYVAIRID